MTEFWMVIFIVSVVSIAHTYLIYPSFMLLFFRKPRKERKFYSQAEELPSIAVLIAAFNEEKVIEQKLNSILESNYPRQKIEILVGSDASTDATDKIVAKISQSYPCIKLVRFSIRSGKIEIVNQLHSMTNAEILFLTDANVLFSKDTIYESIKFFKDDQVGIVASNIIKQAKVEEGITYQEQKYLSFENKLKAAESNAADIIMGAEGGCYAIKNNLFSRVPLKFNVDDFFITLQVIARGKKTLFNPESICFEDVHSDPSGEYMRKVRISSGNFQNLLFFRKILISFWKPLGFMFLSHKVLRWWTPFFLITALISSLLLAFDFPVFALLFFFQCLFILVSVIDNLIPINQRLIKFIAHFYLMNLALFMGFIKFTKGIQSSIWQPIKRNV